MKNSTKLNRLFYFFILVMAPTLLWSKESKNVFLEDDSSLNGVENILLDTRISAATNTLSIGFIDWSRLGNLVTGNNLYIKLPDKEQEVTLSVEQINIPIENIQTLAGSAQGYPDSEFVLAVDGNTLLGSIKLDGMVYIVEPTSSADGRHVIHQMNPLALPQDPDDVIYSTDKTIHKSQLKAKLPPEKLTKRLTGGNVRVLFLYANNVTSAQSLASRIVTEFDMALRRSGVSNNNRISAAGRAQLVNDDFNGKSRQEILNYMANRQGVFSDIDIRMRSVGADIAVLLIKTDLSSRVFGGLAYGYERNFPFALTTDLYALGDLTAVHEIGHVLDGAHAQPLQEGDSPSDDPRGYGVEGSNGTWQTIMGGYTQACNFDSNIQPEKMPCKRIGYFSNPAMTNPPAITEGEPIGYANADMKSVLELRMPTVSNWGTTQDVNYANALPGFAFDPMKNGHGIHLSRTGNTNYLYFYTYDAAGNPEWYYGFSNFSNNRLSGRLYRVRYNYSTASAISSEAGSFTLDYSLSSVNANANCDGVNRNLQPGVFSWYINGQYDSWCMQPLFNNNNQTPRLPTGNSGLWYEPALSGWGFSLQTVSLSTTVIGTFSVVFYYDSSGTGRWAAGQRPIARNSLNTIDYLNLNHFNGYPRNTTGTVSSEDIGRFTINFGAIDRASIDANYPNSPFGRWLRTAVVISRLTL